MSQADTSRFVTMADAYDRMAPYLLPHYDFLQNAMLDYLGIDQCSQPVVVDIGAGSGILLERVLSRNPGARCYWVDSSETFLEIARRRLAPYDDRVGFVLCSMESDWERQIGEAPDAIFSMSAIHHLENEEKRDLYRRCFDCLAEFGWLVNIDEMKTVYSDAYYNSLLYWLRHVRQSGAAIPLEHRAAYDQWMEHFEDWKRRNIDQFDAPKSKGDDLHEVFTLQMEWLRQIGFENVDLFVKVHLWCVIGGQKPAIST